MTNQLRISEEVFIELYPDLAEDFCLFNEPVPANLDPAYFEKYYLRSKLWRLNNLYKVIDKDGNPVQFKMNYAQHRVYSQIRKHPRILILKSRQQGISTFFLVNFLDDAMFCPFLNIGLMAQGAAEAATLLERSKFLWEQLDEDIKKFLKLKLKKDNTKEIAFSNNSTVFIRVSFRSTTLQRLHVSEFGKIANENPKRAKETKTGTLQALARGNTGAIESTAEGKNLFKTMWDEAERAIATGQLSAKDFYPLFLPWHEDPDCIDPVYQTDTTISLKYFDELAKQGIQLTQEQKNFWIVQYRELLDDIYQEYPATPEEAFKATRDGTYYSKIYKKYIIQQQRIVEDLYDPNLPVEVYFDLGVDDYFVLGYLQKYKGENRIIGDYFNNGYDLIHYIDKALDSGFDITSMVFPHDIMVRELGTGTAAGKAKTRYEMVVDYLKSIDRADIHVRVLRKSSIDEGIELVKQMLKETWFDSTCTYLMDCVQNYTKEWDEKLEVWKTTPKHDEYSHGADVLRQMAIGAQTSLGRIRGSNNSSRSDTRSSHAV